MAGVQAAVDKIWDKYDTDKSGALDRKEVEPFIRQVLGDLGKQCPSTEEIDAFFADLDKDGNMLISKDEMAAFITKMTADLFAA